MIFSNSRTSIVFKKSYVNSIKLRGKYFIDRQTNIHSEVDMIPIAWCSKNKERKKTGSFCQTMRNNCFSTCGLWRDQCMTTQCQQSGTLKTRIRAYIKLTAATEQFIPLTNLFCWLNSGVFMVHFLNNIFELVLCVLALNCWSYKTESWL